MQRHQLENRAYGTESSDNQLKITLAGVDLAWQSRKNPTAIAVGELRDSKLVVTAIYKNVYTREAVLECLHSQTDLRGVAIDAPLVINNSHGQRPCERDLGKEYSSRHASCHTSNQTLYPDPDSVYISSELAHKGFHHLGGTEGKWQLECYPHPAIIEIFGLPERLKYKKGRVDEKREGQKKLAALLKSLESSSPLDLKVPPSLQHHLDIDYISGLRGRALKHNEDVLDAIICLLTAGLFQSGNSATVFGSTEEGYVYVPTFSR